MLMDVLPENSVWDMTVSLSIPAKIDEPAVREALAILLESRGSHEIRGLKDAGERMYVRSRMVRADRIDKAIQSINELGDSNGIYYTLNPVRPTLGDVAAKVADILSRRWFLVDVDRKKTKDSPTNDLMATDEEKARVFELANMVGDWLIAEGWPVPTMIDSGNGAHLLYRIDQPNTDLSRLLLSRAIKALAARFNNEHAEIDVKVIDAPRISKLPGTWVRKGPNTVERPWRIARLLYAAPEVVVTLEQLEALTHQGKPHPDEPKTTPDAWTMVCEAPKDRVGSYVRSGVERNIANVVLSNPGGRNHALNAAAFAIGQLVGGKFIARGEAEQRLKDAASRIGLGEHEIDRTIESGLDAGIKSPRVLPASVMGGERNGTSHHEPAKPKMVGERLTIGLDELQPEKVEWIYENRVAPGFISIFAGRTGLGKSFVTCDIVAKLSLGCSAPYSRIVQPPIRTLFISEDSPKVVIGPRLIELGADRGMVRFMTFDAMAQYTLADVDMLGRAYEETMRPKLVVIDPPANFLGKIDEHKNAEVRSTLKLLSAWLESHRVACIFIMHINKAVGKGLDAVERIVGSVAWGTSARITLAFTKDPNTAGQLLFGGTKNNLGPLAETVAYKIVKTETLATVQWMGQVDTTMEDAMNSVKKKSRGQCAVEWLTDRFREKREWESDTLREDADNNGISKNALWSPEAQALPILKRQRVNAAGDRAWFWIAEAGWPAEQIENGNLGT